MLPHSAPFRPSISPRSLLLVFLGLSLWASSVALASSGGLLAPLLGVRFAALVVAGVAAPAMVALGTAAGRDMSRAVGLAPLTLLHVWRIPAGLLFLWYGSGGDLPPAFWVPAGLGDLLVGVIALFAVRGAWTLRAYRRFHQIGFADFLVAVGSGLVHTLLADPRIGALAAMPLVLIPLFGVGVSGASHLVAFWLLRGADARAHVAARWSTRS